MIPKRYKKYYSQVWFINKAHDCRELRNLEGGREVHDWIVNWLEDDHEVTPENTQMLIDMILPVTGFKGMSKKKLRDYVEMRVRGFIKRIELTEFDEDEYE